jgi:hypothetical protein
VVKLIAAKKRLKRDDEVLTDVVVPNGGGKLFTSFIFER